MKQDTSKKSNYKKLSLIWILLPDGIFWKLPFDDSKRCFNIPSWVYPFWTNSAFNLFLSSSIAASFLSLSFSSRLFFFASAFSSAYRCFLSLSSYFIWLASFTTLACIFCIPLIESSIISKILNDVWIC